jgi:hypothetical protein
MAERREFLAETERTSPLLAVVAETVAVAIAVLPSILRMVTIITLVNTDLTGTVLVVTVKGKGSRYFGCLIFLFESVKDRKTAYNNGYERSVYGKN